MLDSTVIWFIIGIVLLLSEFLIPGFIIFFFGVGGIITSILLFFISPLDSIYWLQIAIFLISSFTLLITLRRKFKKTFRGELYKDKDDYIGEECVVIEKVSENKSGRILFQGTTWTAFSNSGKIEKNKKATIIGKKDNMVFLIEKKR